MEKYICINCKKTFKRPKCQVKDKNDVCCSKKCRYERQKGENNPNWDNRWNDKQKEKASNMMIERMKDPHYRFLAGTANRGKSPSIESKQKMSESQKKRTDRIPPTKQTKLLIGIGSKKKFTPEFKEKFKKTMVERGYWLSEEQKTDWNVYVKEANWIEHMFNRVTSKEELKLLKECGVFHSTKNSKGVVRDHAYSRRSGFDNKIFPELLRHPCNVNIITHSDNVKKKKSQYVDADIITLKELFDNIQNYDGNWNEHNVCLQLIEKYNKGIKWIRK
jgi:hypothetical protein